MKSRLKYLLLSMLLFIIELIIAIYLHDNIIRAHVGDVLVVVLIYCIIRIFIVKEIKLLPLYVFAFAVFVEIMQFFDIVSILHLQNIAIMRIIIGSTFDWADILCYFTGALISAFIQWIDRRNGKIVIPTFIITGLIFTSVFIFLMYNGYWWPINPESMGYKIKGIDVARYQGDIDWKVISEQNIKFAYIKATEGSSYQDPFFEKNIIESKNNGIANGSYHFFSTESSGTTQALNFLSTIMPFAIDMPPVVDFEIDSSIDKVNIIEELRAFMQEVQSYTGLTPIIYTTYESYNPFLSSDFSDYDFWFRDLLHKPSIDGNLVFWQYCNRGRLNGIDKSQKYVDMNVFIGNEQEFVKFLKIDK